MVTNTGNANITGVSVSDPLLGAMNGLVESIASDSILQINETWTYTGSYTVLQLDIDNNGGGDGDIDNMATLSSNELSDKTDAVSVAIDYNPAYTLSKTIADVGGNGPTGVVKSAGTAITYNIVLTNTGNSALTGVLLSNQTATLGGITESVSANGILDVGEQWTCTATYLVTQSDIDNRGIDATGAADGDGDIDSTTTADCNELSAIYASAAVRIYAYVSIPTLNEWGMIIMSILMLGFTIYFMRRSKSQEI